MIVVSVAEGRMVSIPASDVLAKIKAAQPAEFENCTIVGDLNLSALKIEEPVHFNSTIFRDSVNFEFTRFNGTANFRNSVFNGTANFRNSVFNGTANFRNSGFNGYADFLKSAFNGTANFGYSVFNGTANFGYSTLNGANFRNSVFNGYAYFLKSKFNHYADFGYSAFNSYADFGNSAFNGYADFGNSAFNGYADFGNSAFDDDANFRSSAFNDNATFGFSAFNGYANFSYSEFKKETIFNDVGFRGEAIFSSSRFIGDALFQGAAFSEKVYLTRTKYDRLYIIWSSFKKALGYDDAAYQLLIENFKKCGLFLDADKCYYQFRVEQFLHRNPIDDPLISLFDLGAWIFYGFGKKPLYPMLWSVFFVVLFGFLWMDMNSKERGHAIKITALVWILLFMAFFGVFFQIDAILSRDLSIFFIVLLGIFWTVIWRNKSKGAIDEYTERWLNNISKAFSFSANVFLSGTKFFVDPPKIPELPRGPRSIVNGMFILERVLGAFFSILLFLAIAGTVVR